MMWEGNCIQCGMCCKQFSLPEGTKEEALKDLIEGNFFDYENFTGLLWLALFVEPWIDEEKNHLWHKCNLFKEGVIHDSGKRKSESTC